MANDAIKLRGSRELKHLCDELPKRVRTKALRSGVSAAAAPIVKATKAGIPRESGLLKKSITKKVKTYAGGRRVIAVIGANVNTSGSYQGRNRVPANYFHLIEGGTAPHAIGKGQHPGTAGQHPLQKAYDAHHGEAAGILTEKMQSTLETEAAKLGRK